MIGHALRTNPEVFYGLAVALVIVILLTPAVGGMARLLGVVDRPGEGRRANTRTVPRLGGIALFLGIFVPALAFLDLTRNMRGLLIGAAVATTVGAIDDFRGLLWWEKLGGQIVAASIPVAFGVWIHSFTFPVLGVHELPVWIGAPLTVLGIVAIMNMVNFLDGLDGLAAGVCCISAATFTVIALDLGSANVAILAAIVVGATAGFLRHNFYPARIFMGDSGALLLGFLLAGISVQGLLKTASLVSLFLPLAVLAVPIIDTSFVVAKRLKHGLPVYESDRFHLHHRFLNIGYSQRRAVLTIYGWCATLAAAALATRFIKPHPHGDWRPWAIAVDAAIGLAAVATSIYIVYLLEIVKLANPIMRRREEQALAEKRKSA
jgi:UDP-GlcNAc:undecaprenyl-phosphate GlcNAc-1-phosphate transferase